MEELLLGHDPMDPCSPAILDTDGDGLCDMYEVLNGSSPFAAEAVLSSGSLNANRPDGFCHHLRVSRSAVHALPWKVVVCSWTLQAETIQGAALALLERWNAPKGVYVLSLPSLGFHSRVVVQN